MTNPSVTRIKPKLSRSIRQHTPFTFGQNGFGADIASMRAPARRERLLRPVFAELATEYKLRGPLECDRCALYRLLRKLIIEFRCQMKLHQLFIYSPVFRWCLVGCTSYINITAGVAAMIVAQRRWSTWWQTTWWSICWTQIFRTRIQHTISMLSSWCPRR